MTGFSRMRYKSRSNPFPTHKCGTSSEMMTCASNNDSDHQQGHRSSLIGVFAVYIRSLRYTLSTARAKTGSMHRLIGTFTELTFLFCFCMHRLISQNQHTLNSASTNTRTHAHHIRASLVGGHESIPFFSG